MKYLIKNKSEASDGEEKIWYPIKQSVTEFMLGLGL